MHAQHLCLRHTLTQCLSPACLALLLLQWYNRDMFWFLFLCLTLVALGSSLQPVRTPLLLNRPQTEEWKGWMQVLFLLYHYFEARELYNAIRIFIAGYVWMTGFGNFSYYYRTGDFSIGRCGHGHACMQLELGAAQQQHGSSAAAAWQQHSCSMATARQQQKIKEYLASWLVAAVFSSWSHLWGDCW